MDYSPFNPLVWLLFFLFMIVIWATVRGHAARNPHYPGNKPEKNEDL
jgi:hypothetical protein